MERLSGVLPSAFLWSISAPLSSNSSAIFVCPFWQAICRGVIPSLSSDETLQLSFPSNTWTCLDTREEKKSKYAVSILTDDINPFAASSNVISSLVISIHHYNLQNIHIGNHKINSLCILPQQNYLLNASTCWSKVKRSSSHMISTVTVSTFFQQEFHIINIVLFSSNVQERVARVISIWKALSFALHGRRLWCR